MRHRPHLQTFLSLAAIALVGAALSCGGGGGGTPPTPTPAPSATFPPGTVSFRSQVYPIMQANCTTAGCHVPASQGGIAPVDYSGGAAATYALLVNKPASGYANALRVKPNDSGNSVLYAKISSDNPTLASGQSVKGDGRMPLNAAPLSAADIATIKTWIDQGVPNS